MREDGCRQRPDAGCGEGRVECVEVGYHGGRGTTVDDVVPASLDDAKIRLSVEDGTEAASHAPGGVCADASVVTTR